MGLTEDQKLRMEQKRAEAIARMKSRTSELAQSKSQITRTTDLFFKPNSISVPVPLTSKPQKSFSSSNGQSNSSSVVNNKNSVNQSPLTDKQRQIMEERRKAAKAKLTFERDKTKSSSS